jgi:hypothetical protein
MNFLLKLLAFMFIGIITLVAIFTSFGKSSRDSKTPPPIKSVVACEKVASYYLDPKVILSSGARSLGVKVLDAMAVRSRDYERFYFVQYKMKTPKNGIVYPMFAMNKPTTRGGGGGVIYSMDDLAVTLTGFGDARTYRDPFSSRDDGFYKASKCLK